jgi:hypothetical protein
MPLEMKRLLIYVVLYLLLSMNMIAQSSLDFYCGEQRHSYDFPAWLVPVQQCDKNKLYSNSVNFGDIPQDDRKMIDLIYRQLEERGGTEFYKKLEFSSIDVSYNPEECNGYKYSFRIIYHLDSIFYDRFSLTFNSEGRLLTAHKFPDISSNPEAHKIISYCSAVERAMQNRKFNEACKKSDLSISRPNLETGEMEPLLNISNLDLEFYPEKNIWTWVLHSETRQLKDKSWVGSVIRINAETGEVIDVKDYNESKIVCTF